RYLNFQPNRGQTASGSANPTTDEASGQGGEHAGLRFGKVALHEDIPFKEAKNQLIEEFEMAYWTRLLERTDGNVSKAARIAGVHRKSLEYILKKLDISRKDLKS
ncbi:MAG: helix-turn-helix domain-containing protein, partial [Myxococcota bacterium]